MPRFLLVLILCFSPTVFAENILPEFQLITDARKSFGKADLKGKVSIFAFIFTHCRGMCPLLVQKAKSIKKAVKNPQVRWVLVSVDPENDTPEALKKYRETHNLDADWVLLTGERQKLRKLIKSGFQVHLSNSSADGVITHSDEFVLVDEEGKILAYYTYNNAKDEKKLTERLNGRTSQK